MLVAALVAVLAVAAGQEWASHGAVGDAVDLARIADGLPAGSATRAPDTAAAAPTTSAPTTSGPTSSAAPSGPVDPDAPGGPEARPLQPGVADTEGDIGEDERAAYAALALRPAPTTEPWQVRYALQTAGETTVALDTFAAVVEATYRDPRGWSLGGAIAFERVSDPAEADFVVVLAEPAAVAEFSEDCVSWQTGEPDASCTVGNDVIINEERWLYGALGDPYPLAQFRVQEINHETGHWLGQGHFSCLGGLAAVNQQQFRSLDGCEANEWPLVWERAMVAERHGLWGPAAPQAQTADPEVLDDPPADREEPGSGEPGSEEP